MKRGYSHATITANIRALCADGVRLPVAQAAALNHARACYFRKFPDGFLPIELAQPKTARRRRDYTAAGEPSGVNRIMGNPKRSAPAPAPRQLAQARDLFESFTGQAAQGVKLLKIPPVKTGVAIGRVLGIIYSVEATGEKFRHSFKASSRPHLVISADGHQAIICGGRFAFTERGFTDQ